MKGYVLDTSVLYYGKDLPQGFECVITPGVVRELDKEGMSARLELLMATRVRVSSPSDKSLRKVSEESEKTGDSGRLSEADKELLALALDLGYELITDDYSIQNLARAMGIPARGFDQKGITEIFEWQAKCKGCGKLFPADVRVCDVCGTETRTRRKKS
ncbi:MAG: nucleic acid-binding protein [Candidatus Thermoplasmatota archaeon]|nr:nucleic acid-binding protein [Candidatus Thermoplasmatota archaeon]